MDLVCGIVLFATFTNTEVRLYDSINIIVKINISEIDKCEPVLEPSVHITE